MEITIEVEPDLGARLKEEAARRGVDPGELARETLREALLVPGRREEIVSADAGVREAELLQEIGAGFTDIQWERYYELVERRRDEQLSSAEHAELVGMADRIDAQNVRRVECLAELAKLRNVSLPQLMQKLGIVPPPVI